MNPGPSEEAGKAAGALISALRDQPALLVLVIFNILFLSAGMFALHVQRTYQHEIMTKLIEKCT